MGNETTELTYLMEQIILIINSNEDVHSYIGFYELVNEEDWLIKLKIANADCSNFNQEKKTDDWEVWCDYYYHKFSSLDEMNDNIDDIF